MINYILLVISISFAAANNVLLHQHGGKKTKAKAFMFQVIVALVWTAILLICRNTGIVWNVGMIGYGLLYGLIQAAFLFFKMQALETGPIVLTTMIGNCSLIVSTALGVVLWGEKISALQCLGVGLLLCAIILCMIKEKDVQLTLKWKLYCAGFFLTSGCVGIVFKSFSKSGCGTAGDMMAVAAVFMAAVYYFLERMFSSGEVVLDDGITRRDVLFALGCGIVSCGYNRINVFLTGALPSIVFFPVFNGMVIILSLFTGFVIFKEKLTLKQAAGFLVGVIAIMMVGIG